VSTLTDLGTKLEKHRRNVAPIPLQVQSGFCAIKPCNKFCRMVLVFVVNGTQGDMASVSRVLFSRYQLTPPQVLRWQQNLCHLAHGKSYARLADCIARNAFNLYFGYPWSHAECERFMRLRFPDALWVDARAVAESDPRCRVFTPACVMPECAGAPESEASADRGFLFTSVMALDSKLQLRTSPCQWQFPCACTRLLLASDERRTLSYKDETPFFQFCSLEVCPGKSSTPDVISLHIDAGVKAPISPDEPGHGTRVAWSIEPDSVCRGGPAAVASVSPAMFARAYIHDNVDAGSGGILVGNVPYGAIWSHPSSVANFTLMERKTATAGLALSLKKRSPGHSFRHTVADFLAAHPVLAHKVSQHGTGRNRPFAMLDMGDVVHSPHMYAIVIENEIRNGWWTEKLVTPLCHGCVVFYWGAPNVHIWFDAGSVIPFGTLDELAALLGCMSVEDYESRSSAVFNNYHRAKAYACYFDNLVVDGDILSVPGTVTSCSVDGRRSNVDLWAVSEATSDVWSEFCRSSAAISKFQLRSSAVVKDVLDHVTESRAEEYYQLAQKALSEDVFARAVEALKEWDALTGGEPSGFGGVSLTATKYLALIGRCSVLCGGVPSIVIEIGGGLGGFAAAMSSLGVRVYCIEMPQVAWCINTICTRLCADRVTVVSALDADAIRSLPPGAMLCSEHAWSECPRTVRESYAANIFPKCLRGWMACDMLESLSDNSTTDQTASLVSTYAGQHALFARSRCPRTYYVWWSPEAVAQGCLTGPTLPLCNASVELVGGLGNRIFGVLALLGYCRKTRVHTPIIYAADVKRSPHDKPWSWRTLFTDIPVVTSAPPGGRVVMEESPDKSFVYLELPTVVDEVHIRGYRQSAKYFSNIEVADRPVFSESLRSAAIGTFADIEPIDFAKAVFLHVRRGDYLKFPLHAIDLMAYYKRCLNLLPESGDTTVVIVSNDTEWCTHALLPYVQQHSLVRRAVVQADTVSDVAVLCTMAMCARGGICANSTLSWLGAYCARSENLEAAAFMPDRWLNGDVSYEGIYPPWCTIVSTAPDT
jgi:hypothetical protein